MDNLVNATQRCGQPEISLDLNQTTNVSAFGHHATSLHNLADCLTQDHVDCLICSALHKLKAW